MDISLPLNLDDGFLRRACPECQREFKWHAGPTEDRPDDVVDPAAYHCPYCGATASPDQWYTEAQVTYAREAAAGPAVRLAAEGLQRSMPKHITFRPASAPDPPAPVPPLEPHDMSGVAPPCHPWEPVKIDHGWVEPIHCLLCGQRFVI